VHPMCPRCAWCALCPRRAPDVPAMYPRCAPDVPLMRPRCAPDAPCAPDVPLMCSHPTPAMNTILSFRAHPIAAVPQPRRGAGNGDLVFGASIPTRLCGSLLVTQGLRRESTATSSSEQVFPEGPDPIAVPMFVQSIDCSALAILSSCYCYGAADSKIRHAANACSGLAKYCTEPGRENIQS